MKCHVICVSMKSVFLLGIEVTCPNYHLSNHEIENIKKYKHTINFPLIEANINLLRKQTQIKEQTAQAYAIVMEC